MIYFPPGGINLATSDTHALMAKTVPTVLKYDAHIISVLREIPYPTKSRTKETTATEPMMFVLSIVKIIHKSERFSNSPFPLDSVSGTE